MVPLGTEGDNGERTGLGVIGLRAGEVKGEEGAEEANEEDERGESDEVVGEVGEVREEPTPDEVEMVLPPDG